MSLRPEGFRDAVPLRASYREGFAYFIIMKSVWELSGYLLFAFT